jgi:hypothetical protein
MKKQFAKRSDWKIKEMSEHSIQLPFKLVMSEGSLNRIKQGVIPDQMEDKWFVFFENNWLYFHRSWTGACIFKVRFEKTTTGYESAEAWASRDENFYASTNVEYDAALLLYLIRGFLLGEEVPFPVKNDTAEGRAMEMWSLIGRQALKKPPAVQQF